MWGWSGQDQLGSSYINSKDRPSISWVPVLCRQETFVKNPGRTCQILYRCVQVLPFHLFPWKPSAFFFFSIALLCHQPHTPGVREFYKPQPTHSQLLKAPGSRWEEVRTQSPPGQRLPWVCWLPPAGNSDRIISIIEPSFRAKKVFKAAQTYTLWWNQKQLVKFTVFTLTFHFHALEKEMATHSSVLAWRIPGMGKPGGLPSMGLRRVGHDWSDLAAVTISPTSCSLPRTYRTDKIGVNETLRRIPVE